MPAIFKRRLPLDRVEGVLDAPYLVTDLVVLLHDLVQLSHLLLHPLVDHSHAVTVHLSLRVNLLIQCHDVQSQFLTHLLDVLDHIVS